MWICKLGHSHLYVCTMYLSYQPIYFAQMFSSIFFQWSAMNSHMPLISYHHQYTAPVAMNKIPISNVCIENLHKLSFAFIQGLRTPNEALFYRNHIRPVWYTVGHITFKIFERQFGGTFWLDNLGTILKILTWKFSFAFIHGAVITVWYPVALSM